jgi:hypothetical protein
MRLAGARITLGVIAARQGDLEQTGNSPWHARSERSSQVAAIAAYVSRDLTKVLNEEYPKETETQAYLDQFHSLSSLGNSRTLAGYALRACSGALLMGSKPALALGSRVAAAAGRWLLMAIRDISGARLDGGSSGFKSVRDLLAAPCTSPRIIPDISREAAIEYSSSVAGEVRYQDARDACGEAVLSACLHLALARTRQHAI